MSTGAPKIGRAPGDDLSPTQARQGEKSGVVRYVLAFSLGGAIIAMVLVYAFF
jgi:hypothetical protein